MSLRDFLFQGSPPPTVSTGSVSIPNMPDWYSEYLRGLFARSNAVAGEQFQVYPGQRVAGFTPDQTRAFDMTRQRIGNWQPSVQQGINTASSVAQGFDPSQLTQFRSPFINNVVDRIGQLGMRRFNEEMLPQVNDQFVGAGQFGSSRHREFTNRAMRDANESITGMQSDALQRAEEAAMSNYRAFNDQRLQGAGALGQLGSNMAQLSAADAASMDAVGQLQQGLNQRGLDVAYQDFVEQRDFPRNNLGMMSNIIRGLSMPSGTATTQTQVSPVTGPSGLQQLSSLYSIYRGVNAR